MLPKRKNPPKYSGKVKKRTHGVLSFWQQRELEIDGENLCCSKIEKKTIIPIMSILDVSYGSDRIIFNVKTTWDYVYTFKTESYANTYQWIKNIKKAIRYYKNKSITDIVLAEPLALTKPDDFQDCVEHNSSNEKIKSIEHDCSDSSDKKSESNSTDSDESDSSDEDKTHELDLLWLHKLCDAMTIDERNALTDTKINVCLKKLNLDMEFGDVLLCCFELIDILEKNCDDLKIIKTKKYDELIDHQINYFTSVVSRLLTPYNLKLMEIDFIAETEYKIGHLIPNDILKLLDFYECFNIEVHRHKKIARQIDEYIDEMVEKYVSVIKKNAHKLITNIAKISASKKETIKTSMGKLGTIEYQDLVNIMGTNYAIVKEHKCVHLKIAVLSIIFSEFTHYVCDILMNLFDLKHEDHIEYICAVANDVGFLLDVMEYYENIVNTSFNTDCMIKGDIERSKTQVINAGYQICEILQSLIVMNIDDIMENIFDKWIHNDIIKILCEKIENNILAFDLNTIITAEYFEKTIEFLMFHIVETYVLSLFKLIRKNSGYKFDKGRTDKLYSDLSKLIILFSGFLDKTMVGFILKFITMMHKILAADVEDIIFILDAEFVEFSNYIYYVYMFTIECVKHHSSANKKVIREFLIDANFALKTFIIKNPTSTTSRDAETTNLYCIEYEKITLVLLNKLYPNACDNYERFIENITAENMDNASIVSTSLDPPKRYDLDLFLDGKIHEVKVDEKIRFTKTECSIDKPDSPVSVKPFRARRRHTHRKNRLFDDDD